MPTFVIEKVVEKLKLDNMYHKAYLLLLDSHYANAVEFLLRADIEIDGPEYKKLVATFEERPWAVLKPVMYGAATNWEELEGPNVVPEIQSIFEIYCAVALIETTKELVKLLELVNSSEVAEVPVKTKYIVAIGCFMTQIELLNRKMNVSTFKKKTIVEYQHGLKAKYRERTEETIVAVANELLAQHPDKYLYETTGPRNGSIRVSDLARGVSKRIKKPTERVIRKDYLPDLIERGLVKASNSTVLETVHKTDGI